MATVSRVALASRAMAPSRARASTIEYLASVKHTAFQKGAPPGNTEELRHGGEADQAALEGRVQRAAELVVEWAGPGAEMRDHVELLLCEGWCASVTLAHAFRFDGARMREYVESHAHALILAGRR